MTLKFDVAIVGAGPAGLSAAITASKAGLDVIVLERGEYIGSKAVCGGMVYSRVLNRLCPDCWGEVPLQRPVSHHRIMMLSDNQSFMLDYGNGSFSEEPYNGWTILRKDFDQWLAKKAKDYGATIITATVVNDLLWDDGKIIGVKARREQGEVYADLVILADGVNSLLARKAGLRRQIKHDEVALGVKELLSIPRETINNRFGLQDSEGASYAIIGDFAEGIPGGGFIYTNKDSVSIGVVAHPDALAASGVGADTVLERFKSKPEIARLISDGRLLEYSAHLIPEGGLSAMPKLNSSGLLVAGDAAGFTVNTGITVRGMNLAIDSGMCAGEMAVIAKQESDYSAASLKRYEKLLNEHAAMPSMTTYKDAPKLIKNMRLYDEYPKMANELFRGLMTVDDASPKSAKDIIKEEMSKVGTMRLLRDVVQGVKAI